MPFEKVETQVDFPAQERAILEFWDRIDAFAKLRAQNAHYDELMAQDPQGTKWQKMSGAWTRSPELFNLVRTP